MSAVQLRLLPPPRPLLDRLGAAFFKTIPKQPGVYRMRDEHRQILYVGQSKNLRARLSAYKYLTPERHSRRLIRLVHQTRFIDWRLCESALAAQLLENEWLRLYQPSFNTANTRPQNYAYIRLTRPSEETRLLRIETAASAEAGRFFGPFKSLRRARRTAGLISRTLWVQEQRPFSHHQIPRRLLGRQTRATEWPLRLSASQQSQLESFLSGADDAFLDTQRSFLEQTPLDPFLKRMLQEDLEQLSEFYRLGPQRNRALIQRRDSKSEWIAKEELDDLLVIAKNV